MANQDPNTQTPGFTDLNPEDQILSIIEREQAPTGGEPEDTNKDPQEQGDQDPAEAGSQDNLDTDPNSQEDGGDDDSGTGDEPAEIYELEDDFVVKLGDDETISFKELREGNLRQADYTKKTQELATQRKEFEETYGQIDEFKQGLQQLTEVRQSLHNELEVFKGATQTQLSELDKTDWDTLKREDPDEYTVKRLERAELKERLDLAQADQQRLVEQQNQQLHAEFTQAVQESNKLLSGENGIPGWTDETKGAAIRNDMKEFALAQGLSEQELNTLVDPRFIKILHVAAQASKAAADPKELARKKSQKVPRVTKPTPSGQRKPKQTSLADRLRKEQSSDAAAATLFDMLEQGKL